MKNVDCRLVRAEIQWVTSLWPGQPANAMAVAVAATKEPDMRRTRPNHSMAVPQCSAEFVTW